MAAAAAAALPDDLLAVILGRLPARSLAASRGICKAWRDLIDERHLLLPHSVRGLFINYHGYGSTHFFSRPTSPECHYHAPRRRIDGEFDFVEREAPRRMCQVGDHCSGLVLLLESFGKVLHVCNPTTRRSARLPPCPNGAAFSRGGHRRAFLVFDPSVSPPEYKVLLSPAEPREKQMASDDGCRLMEWPPPAWATWHEFSSSTGRWEEKVFVREGEAAGKAGDLLLHGNHSILRVEPQCRYAAYWKGALYIHCRGEFVSRLSLLDDKYRVIKSPLQLAECRNDGVKSFLGRSEKGVYIAAIASDALLAKLRVWTLSEESAGGQMEWVPKDQSNLKINTHSWCLENNEFDESKFWILGRNGGRRRRRKNQDDASRLVERSVCWDSDDDNVAVVSDDKEEALPSVVEFLGFHPFKEVMFLCSHGCAVAFHLNSTRVQYLGTVHLSSSGFSSGFRSCLEPFSAKRGKIKRLQAWSL